VVRRLWTLLLLLVPGIGLAADPNQVEGSYTVDGNQTPLKFAYAFTHKKEGKPPCRAVLFSATPLSASDLKVEDPFQEFANRARKGQVQALEALFCKAKEIEMIYIYDKAFDGALQTGGMEKFEAKKFDLTGVAGKISMDHPSSFFKQKYQFDISFSVAFAP